MSAETFYALLADLLVGVHLAYVGYVVIGLVLIVLGICLGWGWVRNPWFRWTHLLAILVVAVEAVIEFECPLTTWENTLRYWATGTIHADTFVGRLLGALMFPTWPDWAYNALYYGLAGLVLLTFLLAPPRRRRPTPLAAAQPSLKAAAR